MTLRALFLSIISLCTVSFLTAMENNHSDNQIDAYVCRWMTSGEQEDVECGEVFFKSKDFYKHVDEKHVIGRNWTCRWNGCHKEYSTGKTDSKRCHMRIHTGERLTEEKPYTCLTCGKSYKVPIRPSRHKCNAQKNDVTDISKKFSCTLCTSSFSEQRCLTDHISVVHAEKRFYCPFDLDCPYKSNTKTKIKRHLKTHLKNVKKKKNDNLFRWEEYEAATLDELAQKIVDGFFPKNIKKK